MRIVLTIIMVWVASLASFAQVGDYRNRFSVGLSGGYAMDNVDFQPTVKQKMHGGMTMGLTGRYTSEKYFSTLCAIQVEANMTQTGWNQEILTIDNKPVINPETGVEEKYERDITYIEIPILAHLSWGKEKRGVCGFVNGGPQFGFMISDKTKQNYSKPFTAENFPDTYTQQTGRVSQVVAQETMPVENKFDYGIAVGAGVEVDIKHAGRFYLEGRYYYGLGNLYGDSKRDYFGRSNHGVIHVKIGYMRDL